MLWVPFHFDDYPTLLRDPATSDFAEFSARLFHGVRPLLRASFFLDHLLWGFDPFFFHLTNLLLHAATAAGVFALAKRRMEPLAAFCAALVFALQPANADVVAYVSGRSTGMATALIVAALLVRERSQALEIVFFVLACLTKEVALVYPALAWWWDATSGDSEKGARPLFRVLAAAAAVAALFALLSRYRELGAFSLALRSPLASLAVNARAVPVMLSLWVRPWALSCDHGFAAAPAPLASAAGAALLLGLAAGAWRFRTRAPLAAFAVGWALLALAPTNSLIAKLDPVTEKPLYLAWLGPSLLLGAALARAGKFTFLPNFRPEVRSSEESPLGILAPALLGLAALGVVARIAVWQSPTTLWLDAVHKAPSHARGWNNLGMALHRDHDEARALAAFRMAVRLDPHDRVARRNLGRLESGRALPPRRTGPPLRPSGTGEGP